DAETVLALCSANPKLRVVLPGGRVEEAREMLGPSAPGLVAIDAGAYVDCGAFEIHGIHAANPTMESSGNGDSLDLGYVVCFGSFAIYHSGDTQWHDTLVREVRRWTINL